MIAPSTHESVGPIVIDYIVAGPRTAAAVAAGTAKLLGMTYQTASAEPCFVSENFVRVLNSFGGRRRVYTNSLLGFALEACNDLPPPADFDDFHVMAQPIGGDDQCDHANAGAKQQDVELLKRASMERVRRVGAQYAVYLDRLTTMDLDALYQQIELPVIAPTLTMTLSGIGVNKAVLEGIQESGSVQLEIAQRQLQELAGRDINLDSPQELIDYLYDELGLPVIGYTRSGVPSTSVLALQPLADQHPAIPVVLCYLEQKPVHDAAQALLEHVQPSGVVFAELNPMGTVTGRFSCCRPNLQGLPAPLLAAVEAAPGHVLLEADMSQQELRVLAHFSQDPRLLKAYTNDVDIHRQTAAAVLGIPERQVTREQRDRYGKPVNFAIPYGTTSDGLAWELGISPLDAQGLLDAYFMAYPGIRQWIDQVRDFVRPHGFVRTLYNRRRQIPDVQGSAIGSTAGTLRQAVNTIIQGTAADLFKLALIRLNQVLAPDVKILLPVHDSVLFEVPEAMVEQAKQDGVLSMETLPPEFSVPLKVEIRTGRTWAECKAE